MKASQETGPPARYSFRRIVTDQNRRRQICARYARRNETILVVEDDPAIRMLVEEILSGAGYKVLVAGTGDRAIQLANEHEGVIHLLLTDVVLPNMGGKEIAGRIALVRPEIKVLFMSGLHRQRSRRA